MVGAGTPTRTERYRRRRCSPPWRRAKERPAVETASGGRSRKSPAKRFCPPKRCHDRVQPTGYGDSVVTRFSPCRKRVPPKRPAEPLPTRTMTELLTVARRAARLRQLRRRPRAIPCWRCLTARRGSARQSRRAFRARPGTGLPPGRGRLWFVVSGAGPWAHALTQAVTRTGPVLRTAFGASERQGYT